MQVSGDCRCQECGSQVTETWRFFPSDKLAMWTIAWCVDCVERKLAETA